MARISPGPSLADGDTRRAPVERYLTVSVDDGHPSDLRTAELLREHELAATFYVPATNPERPVLSTAALRELAEFFEIGGHTYGHRILAGLPDDVARREIRDGKSALEDRTGKPVVAFCYPMGKLSRRTPALVREAGFWGARTSRFNLSTLPADPYRAGVSTHARPYARHVQLRHALLQRSFRGAANFFTVHRLARDWTAHFAAALDWVDRHGGVAHLYLHSWEIEEHDDWRRLRDVLADAAKRERFIRVTNGELFRRCGRRARAGEASSERPLATA